PVEAQFGADRFRLVVREAVEARAGADQHLLRALAGEPAGQAVEAQLASGEGTLDGAGGARVAEAVPQLQVGVLNQGAGGIVAAAEAVPGAVGPVGGGRERALDR